MTRQLYRLIGAMLVFTLAGILAWQTASAAHGWGGKSETPYDDSVVRVMVTYQMFDPFMPWQRGKPGVRYGYGVIVGDSTVLTTEDLVRNHTMIELRKCRSGEKFQAKVLQLDADADLALLKIEDPKKMGNLKPLRTVSSLPKDAALQVVQFDETGEVQEGEAKIEKVSVRSLSSAPSSLLTFRLRTDLNVNGRGCPVLYNGRLVGLMIEYYNSRRTATVLPYPVLQHFLKDVENPPYKGFAVAGFGWAPLIDPAKRRYLGVEEDGRGVLALSTLPLSGASGILKAEDVVMEWDGSPIDNLGYYDDPDFGRLALPYLIKGRRYPGDTVPVKIIRNKKPMTVNVRLIRRTDGQSLIPQNTLGAKAEYLVEGGMVIRELTGTYLHGYGENWRMRVDSRLTHLYITRSNKPEKIGDRVVILSHVLPDPINAGYQHLTDEVITHVNGDRVRNMADVFRVVDRDSSVTRLTLQSVDIDLVLSKAGLWMANRRLSRSYQIPQRQWRNKKPAAR